MIAVQYGRKNLASLLFILVFCVGSAVAVIGGVLRIWFRNDSLSMYIVLLAIFLIGYLVFIGLHHFRLYRRESKVIGVSVEGLHLVDGTIYRFKDALSILPIGLMGFQIKFSDGWNYQPTYLSADIANWEDSPLSSTKYKSYKRSAGSRARNWASSSLGF